MATRPDPQQLTDACERLRIALALIEQARALDEGIAAARLQRAINILSSSTQQLTRTLYESIGVEI
jgi:hypothetical protein